MILMHKDEPAAIVSIAANTPHKIEKIINKKELPIGIYSENENVQMMLMHSWYRSRSIPISRPSSDAILQALGANRAEAFMASSGISLTDTFWLKEEDNPLKWADVNFYDNSFDPIFAKYYLDDDTMSNFYKLKPSPDFTTDGMLEKFWVSSFGTPYLIKMDKEYNGVQSANEVVASKIATLAGIDAVPYSHAFVSGQHCCACPSFIKNSNKDFVSGLQLVHSNMGSPFDLYSALPKEIEKVVALDVLLGNIDRHEKNVGLIDDKLAPIFDTGSCLNYNHAHKDPYLKMPKLKRSEISIAFLEISNNDCERIIKEVYDEFEIPSNYEKDAIESLRYGFELMEKCQESEVER